MEILLVANWNRTFRINSGGDLRNNLFVSVLSGMGHVDVISFIEDEKVSNIPNCDIVFSKKIEDSHSCVGGVLSIVSATIWPANPYSYYQVTKEKETLIDSFVGKKKYDIIVCRYVDSAIRCGLLKYKDRLIIDADDNLKSVLKYQATQEISIAQKWKKLYKAKRIGKMLNKLFVNVLCSFCSNQSELFSSKTVFLHNTSILKDPLFGNYQDNRILFVGSMKVYPNRQGIIHFVEAIFPLIRRSIPSAKLCLVGEKQPDCMDYLNSKEGVEIAGKVEDLVSEYQKAAVVVVPIYYGSGTSIKFVEALLMNRPVVSSPIGARGFSEICKDGVHYMLANNDEEFANKTIELLSSPSKAKEIADNGYDIANKNYSQERFFEIVKEAIQDAYSKSKS